MMLQLLVVSLLSHVTAGNQNAAAFSAEEIRFFESLQLCKHFGGSCGVSCPFRYIRHRWNVPLCPSHMECCIGPPPSVARQNENEALTTSTTTTSPSTTTIITTTPPPPSTTTRTTTATTTLAPPPPPPHLSDYRQPGTQTTDTSCGLAPTSSNVRNKRIVGGNLASPGSWPWLVALRSMLGSHACSGALIGPRWVLTAAHCFKHISNPSLWRVRVSEYDLLDHDDGETDVHMEAIVMHPGYRIQRGENVQNQTLYTRYVNDIALVHLREDAGAEPICLPANEETSSHDYGQCWVAGWGRTLEDSHEDQRLREVSGPVIPNGQCSRMWNATLQETMMCFGDGTYGPCTGDSGSPLSCQRPGSRYTLEGIVSWGTEGCNLSGYPSVFTRVRPYMSWIRHHMQSFSATG